MSRNGARGTRHRVVIVGGGFGGVAAARKLKRADVDVTVTRPRWKKEAIRSGSSSSSCCGITARMRLFE